MRYETKLRNKTMITEETKFTQNIQVWAIPASAWTLENYPEEPPFKMQVRTDKPWDTGAVMVHEEELDVVVPAGIDLNAQAISTLEDAAKEIQKETADRLAEIKKQIQSLLCIEHQPEEVDLEQDLANRESPDWASEA